MTGPNDDAVHPSSKAVLPGSTLELGFGVYVFSLSDLYGPCLETLYEETALSG